MSTFWGNGQLGKELPRPQWTVTLLSILALLLWLVSAVAVAVWAIMAPRQEVVEYWLVAVAGLLVSLALGGLIIGMALLLKYVFSTAVSDRLIERMVRETIQKKPEAIQPSSTAGISQEEVVSLLSEIMENTLLDDKEKATKRESAKRLRQQILRREIEALIKAGKHRDAHDRMADFRQRYPDSPAIGELEAQLSEALRQHEQTEIANVTEQVQRYIGLGLWERALELARGLAEQFPENPEAAKLPDTVLLEQEGGRRQEQQRLYREIEHLVVRKHWRQALRAAETLVQNHPESPEAGRLRDQMEELRRNAGIAERKEWEARIAEHIQTGRHSEAYDLAVELMEKYPDSPQAEEIRKGLDQLKARAGIIDE